MGCQSKSPGASPQILSDSVMDDKQSIENLYQEMYQAMVSKDTVTLNRVHADNFVLTHMTGMHQSKQEYIRSIAGGTLNYYSAQHEQMDITVNGDHATLTGRSRVNAAVFGGGRHTWQLQLSFTLVKHGRRVAVHFGPGFDLLTTLATQSDCQSSVRHNA